MLYIQTSEAKFSGTPESDSNNNGLHTELGSELFVTRMRLISDIQTHKYNPNQVTVITHKDRQCLYPFVNSTVATEDFKLRWEDQHVCYCDHKYTLWYMATLWPYEHKERDKELITSFTKCEIPLPYKFVGLSIRKRGIDTRRELPDDFYTELIDKLNEKDYTVYVFGKQISHLLDGKNAYNVNLQEWLTIMNDKNCRGVIGCATGAMGCCQLFSNTKYLVLDHTDEKNADHNTGNVGNHPLAFGECSDFSQGQKTIINTVDVKEVMQWL